MPRLLTRRPVVVDPMRMGALLWPHVKFYNRQRDIIYSVVENTETVVVAGNMLGKDFVAAFITLWFFLTRHPVRIVTTSADHLQLESVLWGEIRRFIQESRVPLTAKEGGPILENHLHLRKALRPPGHPVVVPSLGPEGRPERMVSVAGNGGRSKYDVCGLSYCIGRVAAKGEGMLGHHVADTGDGIPRTLMIADEASGVDDDTWLIPDTWAKRKLAIGNPYPCQNFFRKAYEEGDLK